jgi:hypothetical protein
MGRFSNVIERARAAEVAATILFKKVLPYPGVSIGIASQGADPPDPFLYV